MHKHPEVWTPTTRKILEIHDANPYLTSGEIASRLSYLKITKKMVNSCLYRHRPDRPKNRIDSRYRLWADERPVGTYYELLVGGAMNGYRFEDVPQEMIDGEWTGAKPLKPDAMSYTGCSAYTASQHDLAGIHCSMKGRK